jgi:hypothetical protein
VADFEESNEGQGMDAWQGAGDTGETAALPGWSPSPESTAEGIEAAFGDDVSSARADLFAGRFDHAGEQPGETESRESDDRSGNTCFSSGFGRARDERAAELRARKFVRRARPAALGRECQLTFSVP